MQIVRLALVGFGNVGQGLAAILQDHQDRYAQAYGIRFNIVAVTDAIKGGVYLPDGFQPADLLAAVQQTGTFLRLPGFRPSWDALEMIRTVPCDAVVELSFTNLQTGEPATSYLAEALRNGKHVVTTNKGPVALHYDQLSELAAQHGVQIGVEGTVMSGTPTIRVGRELLAAAGITRVQGILNGTTNFILTQMEAGAAYQDALAEAQAHGYAEADPTGDVEGFDAAAKVAILARLLFGVPLSLQQIERTGITALTMADIQAASAAGEVWKLIGSMESINGKIAASVAPRRLPTSHPLARVSGATNAVTFTTQLMGDITLIGPGAGRLPTGYALIEDLLAIFAG
jgi:homoserine dehydrogenase